MSGVYPVFSIAHVRVHVYKLVSRPFTGGSDDIHCPFITLKQLRITVKDQRLACN